MVELFLHPWAMALGGALISVPIIIHLINRMRFRRVRWAAMEFLLKSQKRNRRRLIIEQLLLLALRCLLVAMAGLLAARFLGFSEAGFLQPQSTTHVVVLDDSLSMTDRWREQGEAKTSFDVGKDLIVEIARSASRAGSAQQMKVVKLSEPANVIFDQRINAESIRDLQSTLDALTCSQARLTPLTAAEAAREICEQGPQDQRVFHFVSDFRRLDWAEPEGTAVQEALDTLAAGGVRTFLVDCAHPYRGETRQAAVYHDNLAVVGLRPEARVAAEGTPVQFHATLANFSNVVKKNLFLTVKVDGVERPEAMVPVDELPPGQRSFSFFLTLTRPGFNQVSANIEDEDAGLHADNKRFAVVEVRKQLPVLVVDGDPSKGTEPGGDSYHLQAVFASAKGYQVVVRGVDELERPGLDQYPCIFLCNVGQLRSDKGVKNLEEYVREGGSVAFFMGDQVKSEFYNKSLYKNGQGVFPAPLADRPTRDLTDEEKLGRLFDGQFKIFLRVEGYSDPEQMPVFGAVYKYQNVFKYLPLNRTFPVPRLEWKVEPGEIDEVVTLPNYQSLDVYKDEAQRLLGRLPIGEAKYEKYQPGLENHRRAVHGDSLTGSYLYELATAIDLLLTDRGNPTDPTKPDMSVFWDLPEMRPLRDDFRKFHHAVQYGDPLVISKRVGRGRAVAFLTSAGRAWNDWAGGSPASSTFPVIILELHKYLTSAGAESDLTVGSPLNIRLDSTRYLDSAQGYFRPEVVDQKPAAGAENDPNAPAAPAASGLIDQGKIQGAVSEGVVEFAFPQTRQPGLYLIDVTPRSEGGVERSAEQRAYVVNVDSRNEGPLERAVRDDLDRRPPSGPPVSVAYPGAPPVVDQRRSDLSESPWFYLVLLLVLIVEQALAVHLSFHLKGNELTPPAAAGRSSSQPQATAAA